MDNEKFGSIKLIFKSIFGTLGLCISGYLLYVVIQINTSIDTAFTANSNAAVSMISALISATKINNDNKIVANMGLGDAVISGEFKSAIQACWYYQATYKSLHPYTILWE